METIKGRKNNRNNNMTSLIRSQKQYLNTLLVPLNEGRGGVSPAYFNRALNVNPIQYALMNNNATVHGIALARNLNNGNSRYINVIAARKGSGAKLMNNIKNNTKKNGKHYIRLSSVPNAVGFYLRQGFKKNGNTNRNGLIPMVFSITPLVVTLKRKR